MKLSLYGIMTLFATIALSIGFNEVSESITRARDLLRPTDVELPLISPKEMKLPSNCEPLNQGPQPNQDGYPERINPYMMDWEQIPFWGVADGTPSGQSETSQRPLGHGGIVG